jgi:GntR family transcriptional regulator
MANEEPLMLEVCYLPLKRFPNLFDHDFEAHSLYHVLEHHYDVQVAEAEHTLEPTVLKQGEAESFKLRVGKPAMLVWVTAYDARREPIEFCQSLVRGDRCQFYFQVTTQRPIVS